MSTSQGDRSGFGDADTPDCPVRIARVADLLGVSTSTLRSWERRYGLGPSERTDGSHRLYTPRDVTVLRRVQELTREGASAREAARQAQDELIGLATVSELHRADPDQRPLEDDIDNLSPQARRMVRAAYRLDTDTIAGVIEAAIATDGVVAAWDHHALPALQLVGAHWAATGEGVEVERLLAVNVRTALTAHTATRRVSGPTILLCTDEHERHDLALYALQAAAADEGYRTSILPSVPPSSLTAAIDRAQPDVVVVFALMPARPGRAEWWAALARSRDVLFAGPGWGRADLSPGVRVNSLSEAVRAFGAIAS